MAVRIIGIDLGGASVKAVRVEAKGRGRAAGQGFEVTGYAHQPVRAPAEGEDATATEHERMSEALGELKRRGGLDGDVFVTGLPGDHAALRTLSFPFSDPKKIAEALPFALEAEIPMDLDDIVLSWSILPKRDALPSDSKGADKGADVLVAWAKREAVQEHLNLLAEHGIDPRHVEFDALAFDDLYDALFSEKADKDGAGPSAIADEPFRTPGGTVIEMGDGAPEPVTAMVDIGHRRTTVCVLSDSRVIAAHMILHGGHDATRALARAIHLPVAEAERGKRKEAFIEVAGAKAQFPEQAQISGVLKQAYAPLVRRLRQVFQSTIVQGRARVVKVLLTGGGSQVLNLERHLSEELNVRVIRAREVSSVLRGQLPLDSTELGAPEAATALAYALSGLAGAKTRARIDFRTGPFAWHGDLDFLRERTPALVAWAAALLLLVGTGGVARALMLKGTEDDLSAQELAMCEQITGVKQDSFSRCLAMIQERVNGTAAFSIPEHSAVDTYMEIVKRLPQATELKRKITELDITEERVKLRGTTTTYEAIDKIVERLQGGRCFSLVEKGKAQNKADGIEFNITITLDCVAAPGDGAAAALPSAGGTQPTAAFADRVVDQPPAALPMPPPVTGGVSTALPAPASDGSRSRAAAGLAADEDLAAPDAAVEPPHGPTGRLTPEQVEERRERLKKLRADRESRRLGGPFAGPMGLGGPNGDAPMSPALHDRLKRRALGVDPGSDAPLDKSFPRGPAVENTAGDK